MKTLAALFVALVATGFAGAAAAQCASYGKQQTAEAPIILPEGSAGS